MQVWVTQCEQGASICKISFAIKVKRTPKRHCLGLFPGSAKERRKSCTRYLCVNCARYAAASRRSERLGRALSSRVSSSAVAAALLFCPPVQTDVLRTPAACGVQISGVWGGDEAMCQVVFAVTFSTLLCTSRFYACDVAASIDARIPTTVITLRVGRGYDDGSGRVSSFSLRRSTLPNWVSGSSSRNSTYLGIL
jgi:hypothetical protein